MDKNEIIKQKVQYAHAKIQEALELLRDLEESL